VISKRGKEEGKKEKFRNLSFLKDGKGEGSYTKWNFIHPLYNIILRLVKIFMLFSADYIQIRVNSSRE